MANEIKFLRSAVPGKAPTTAQLGLGQLALNTYDGKAYIKKSVEGVESIVELGATPAATPALDLLTSKKVISQDLTIEAGYNAMSIHDVEVADGVTVTVPVDSTWLVIG